MKVRYTRQAKADLDAILAYLDDRSVPGAQNGRKTIIRHAARRPK